MATALPTYAAFVPQDDAEDAVRWKIWMEGFTAMVGAMAISMKMQDQQRFDLLYHYIGPECRRILNNQDDNGVGGRDYTAAKEALQKHFTPRINRAFIMHSLHQETQSTNESISQLHLRVKEKVQLLDLHNLSKAKIIDLLTLSQLVEGTHCHSLRKKALKEDISLKELLSSAKTYESLMQHTKAYEQDTLVSVNKVKSKPGHRSRQNYEKEKELCRQCGYVYPHRGQCPAKDKECHACGRIGHFTKMCRQKRKMQQVTESETNEDNSDDSYEVPYVAAQVGATRNKTKLLINKKSEICVIDTGAELNVMGKQTAVSLNLNIKHSSKTLYGYNHNELPVVGCASAKVTVERTGISQILQFEVVEGDADTLIGCESSVDLKLVAFINMTSCNKSLQEEFHSVFQGIGKMRGVKLKLHIDDSVRPVQQRQRRIPFHLRPKVEEELERLTSLDIIEKATGPTTWVSPLVVVPKDNGEVRLCIDSRALNLAIRREKRPIPTMEDLKQEVAGSKHFSVIDMNKGYHQIELEESSRDISTFETHLGLFRHKRLFMGAKNAAEDFQELVRERLKGISGSINMSDDILVHGKTQDQHDNSLRQVLEMMQNENLTANGDKCKFNKKEVVYFGHIFSERGIRPTNERIRALAEASAPSTTSETRSLLGLAQYLAHFIRDFSTLVAPIRELTRKEVKFQWKESQQQALTAFQQEVKRIETTSYFDVSRPTEIIVDASPVGVGGVLVQIKENGFKQVVEYASRPLTDVESRYSQTEREMLAVVWALEHFDIYIKGDSFVVLTDHQPLIGIWGKTTTRATARLERLMLRLQPYEFKLKYKKGTENEADYLSRHPVGEKTTRKSWVDKQIAHVINGAIQPYETHLTKSEIQEATKQDSELNEVIEILAGIKPRHMLSGAYKRVQDQLSFADGLVLRGDRIVVPTALQQKAVDVAHSSHLGIVKTKSLIRESLWFPGIDRRVEASIKDCVPCQASLPPKKERGDVLATPLPESAWDEISVDFYGPLPSGEYLMVAVDDFSRYPEVEILHALSAKAVMPRLDALFARHGVPNIMKTDNGPPFNGSEISRWGTAIGFHHRKITPLWPQANGEAERFMRTLGKALKTSILSLGSWKQGLYRFLRHYRATPHATTGLSPAEMLLGRKIRTELPSVTKGPLDATKLAEAIGKDKEVKEKASLRAKTIYKPCPRFEVGDSVLVRQQGGNKLSTPYHPEPMIIIQKKGSMITAENESKTITRDQSHFRKLTNISTQNEENKEKHGNKSPSDIEQQQSEDNHAAVENNRAARPGAPDRAEEPQIEESPGQARPSRAKAKPSYLKDYICEICRAKITPEPPEGSLP